MVSIYILDKVECISVGFFFLKVKIHFGVFSKFKIVISMNQRKLPTARF